MDDRKLDNISISGIPGSKSRIYTGIGTMSIPTHANDDSRIGKVLMDVTGYMNDQYRSFKNYGIGNFVSDVSATSGKVIFLSFVALPIVGLYGLSKFYELFRNGNPPECDINTSGQYPGNNSEPEVVEPKSDSIERRL